MQKSKELVQEISNLVTEVNFTGEVIVFFEIAAHVEVLSVRICDKGDHDKCLYKEGFVYYKGEMFNEKYLKKLKEIKSELQRYLPNEFQSIWEQFQGEIEAEIVDCIRHGFAYTEESLFHDVYVETSGHEINLDCVYQSMKLFKGVAYAKKFKQEMYDLIEWLSGNVHANYSEYDEKEVI